MPKPDPIADANTSRRNILIGGAGIAAAIGLPGGIGPLKTSLRALLLRAATTKEHIT